MSPTGKVGGQKLNEAVGAYRSEDWPSDLGGGRMTEKSSKLIFAHL